MNEVTRELNGDAAGMALPADQLLAVVYQELRRLAAAKMASEASGQTLQPTALVHEAWLRLTNDEERRWNDRTHFFAAAAEAMRRILVDNARRKGAKRHGGGFQRVRVMDVVATAEPDDARVLAVDEALMKFAALDPQKAELVKLRYFMGMTIEEAAAALAISERTAKRYWTFSRAWLHEEIRSARD